MTGAIAHQMGECPIRKLNPGDRFKLTLAISGKTFFGTLVRNGPGTSAVLIDGHEVERDIQTQEGPHKIVRRSGGITYWSTGTAVVPLNEQRDVSGWHHKFDKQGIGIVNTDTDKKENADMTTAARAAALPIAGKTEVKKAAKGKIAVVKKAKAAPAPTPKKALSACLCGCGDQVTGRFRMGHDARYHGWLRKLAGGMSVQDINKVAKVAVSQTVLAALAKLDPDRAKAARLLLKAH